MAKPQPNVSYAEQALCYVAPLDLATVAPSVLLNSLPYFGGVTFNPWRDVFWACGRC
jgi:hypothetical protein